MFSSVMCDVDAVIRHIRKIYSMACRFTRNEDQAFLCQRLSMVLNSIVDLFDELTPESKNGNSQSRRNLLLDQGIDTHEDKHDGKEDLSQEIRDICVDIVYLLELVRFLWIKDGVLENPMLYEDCVWYDYTSFDEGWRDKKYYRIREIRELTFDLTLMARN